jgi:hypothetical protein
MLAPRPDYLFAAGLERPPAGTVVIATRSSGKARRMGLVPVGDYEGTGKLALEPMGDPQSDWSGQIRAGPGRDSQPAPLCVPDGRGFSRSAVESAARKLVPTGPRRLWVHQDVPAGTERSFRVLRASGARSTSCLVGTPRGCTELSRRPAD